MPLSIYFGFDIGKYREKYLPVWAIQDSTLFHYTLSSFLFYISFFITYLFNNVKRDFINTNYKKNDNKNYLYLSYISIFITFIFELINFIRVGGFKALHEGKTFYQSAVNNLSFTLPSEGFFYISIVFFFLLFKELKNKFFYLYIFLITSFFYLYINIYIGERGVILFSLIYIFISFTFYKIIKQIKIRYIFLVFIIFISLTYITAYRSIYQVKKDKTTFIEVNKYFFKKKLFFYINPSNTEFGAPCLIYRAFIYYNKNYDNYYYGLTYFYFIPNSIPTYILPLRVNNLEKEMVHKYFVDRDKGSIAGLGYSALLESYINFWYIGPLILGFLLSLIIKYFEYKKYNNILYSSLYIISVLPLLLIFRSSSTFILSSFFLLIIQFLIVYIIYKFLLYFSNRSI